MIMTGFKLTKLTCTGCTAKERRGASGEKGRLWDRFRDRISSWTWNREGASRRRS